jgi:metal-responsive CopG/Arc/MetJ family transcriptional regulator
VPKRKGAERRGRGRPPKRDAANRVVGVRLSKRMIKLLDTWAEGNAMTRSAAAREIIKRFLDK